jgi:hypothetical protein
MKIFKVGLILILFTILGVNIYSQEKKNVITAELLGKSLTVFDVSYARYLSERFQVGAGIGLENARKVGYDTETYMTYLFNFPIYGAYAWGTDKNHAISEFGVNIRAGSNFHGETGFSRPLPFISLGYEHKGDNFIFRIPVYAFYMGRDEIIPLMPWLGISVGRRF